MIKIGIIKENKIPTDNRTPLTPKQAKKIKNNGIEKVSKKYEVSVNFMQSELKW